MTTYQRNCPSCKRELSYKNQYSMIGAEHIGSVCKSCAASKRMEAYVGQSVDCYTVDGQFIKTYEKMRDVWKDMPDVALVNIYNCCKRKPMCFTSYGYKWTYHNKKLINTARQRRISSVKHPHLDANTRRKLNALIGVMGLTIEEIIAKLVRETHKKTFGANK